MAEWLKVILLGLVEGVTEFLPISSTGHLIVVAALLDFNNSLNGTFEIFIQIGAVFAVIWYYRADLYQQARTLRTDQGVRRLWSGIFIAFLPAAWLGFLFADTIEATLFSPEIVAMSLIFGGIVFLVVEKMPESPSDGSIVVTQLSDVTPRQALTIGLLQSLALIPGMSRSGVSIIGGLLAGLNRKTATQFSFYLAIPTLGGAATYKLLTALDQIDVSSLGLLLLGTIVSGIVAWLSIEWLLRYVSRNSFILFGYYRIVTGGLILALIALKVL